MFNTFSNKIIFKRKEKLTRKSYQIIGLLGKEEGTRWEYGDAVYKARLGNSTNTNEPALQQN